MEEYEVLKLKLDAVLESVSEETWQSSINRERLAQALRPAPASLSPRHPAQNPDSVVRSEHKESTRFDRVHLFWSHQLMSARGAYYSDEWRYWSCSWCFALTSCLKRLVRWVLSGASVVVTRVFKA